MIITDPDGTDWSIGVGPSPNLTADEIALLQGALGVDMLDPEVRRAIALVKRAFDDARVERCKRGKT